MDDWWLAVRSLQMLEFQSSFLPPQKSAICFVRWRPNRNECGKPLLLMISEQNVAIFAMIWREEDAKNEALRKIRFHEFSGEKMKARMLSHVAQLCVTWKAGWKIIIQLLTSAAQLSGYLLCFPEAASHNRCQAAKTCEKCLKSSATICAIIGLIHENLLHGWNVVTEKQGFPVKLL